MSQPTPDSRSKPVPPTEQQSVPSLSIAHLMLFTAGTAGYLAITRLLVNGDERGDDFNLWLDVGYATCNGPPLAVLILLPLWRRRSIRFPLHSGDWLLVLQGIGICLHALAVVSVRGFWPNAHLTPLDVVGMTIYGVGTLAITIWCLVLAFGLAIASWTAVAVHFLS